MSGEGAAPYRPPNASLLEAEYRLETIADVRERVERHLACRQEYRWDKRPGTLNVEQPRCGIVVVGSRAFSDEWSVLAVVTGEDGTFCQVALEPDRAEALAAELQQMAAVVREGRAMAARRERERAACR